MFRDECRKRGWLCASPSERPSHYMLDGGKLAVPDGDLEAFTNVYFRFVALKKERLCAVELKSPVFRLFFDLDVRFPSSPDASPARISSALDLLEVSVHRFVVDGFFELSPASKTSWSCRAPPKTEGDAIKHGCHLVFENVFVNSPIALSLRSHLLACIDDAFGADDLRPCNEWADVIDDSVYKANGLRMLFSGKGRNENRAYVPRAKLSSSGSRDGPDGSDGSRDGVHVRPLVLSPETVQTALRACAIRTPNAVLTPCVGGEHLVADDPNGHGPRGAVVGQSKDLALYADALESLRQHLLPEHRKASFTGVFVTDHAAYVKVNSRYCANVAREHRTSTIFYEITSKGVCQRCYSRKDTHGCSSYRADTVPLSSRIVKQFLPSKVKFLDEIELQSRTPASKRKDKSVSAIMKRSRFMR
jgi:hypothetical protein